MMNPRENYLALLAHEDTDYVPSMLLDVVRCGGQLETFENGPLEGGYDDFGCNWIPTDSAGGQPALDPTIQIVDDICTWEDKVVFPDLDKYDWQAAAEQQLAEVDRTQKVVEYHTWNMIFLRFTHLLGFEDALCAMYEEPEASAALMDALCDYKIALLERAHKYFKPDSVITYDDVATERATFMSPEIYRELIKPRHKRFNDAAIAMGIIPQIHCCGYCTDLIEDYIDEGATVWQAAQPSNDIAALIEKHKDEFSIHGGYNTQGEPGAPNVTDEKIIAEVDRCFDEYGCFGKGYAFFGFFMGSPSDPVIINRYGVMTNRLLELRAQGR